MPIKVAILNFKSNGAATHRPAHFMAKMLRIYIKDNANTMESVTELSCTFSVQMLTAIVHFLIRFK